LGWWHLYPWNGSGVKRGQSLNCHWLTALS
jgi:hypothetical protein